MGRESMSDDIEQGLNEVTRRTMLISMEGKFQAKGKPRVKS